MNIKLPLVSLLLLFAFGSFGQGMPVGYWRAHMPYNNALSIATNGTTLFVASDQSFYTYNAAQQETTTYSKVEGMADVGMSFVDYDPVTDNTIIVYSNTNIDLFRNGTFFNLPDIKLRSITGSKVINNIYTIDGLSYLSTSFGIVVVNLDKKEIKETYSFVVNNQNINVRALASTSTMLYAVTDAGVYKANKNSPNLQAFSSWTQVTPKSNLLNIAPAGDEVLVNTNDSLFSLDATDVLNPVYASPWEIRRVDAHSNSFWVSEYRPQSYNGVVRQLNTSYQVTDSFSTNGRPNRTVALSDQSIWVADGFNGLAKREGASTPQIIRPAGPASESTFDVLADNGEFWVAHGSHGDTWGVVQNANGISRYKDGAWQVYNRWTNGTLNGTTDYISLAKDPADGTIYAGSYTSGLLIIKPDGTLEIVKTGILQPAIGDPGTYRVSGVTFDQNGNLWLTQTLAAQDLVVRTKEGTYVKHSGVGSTRYTAYPTIDDYNQKWYILPGSGLAVYNDNNTPENSSDDSRIEVPTSSVSSNVKAVVKDKDGAIWFGTSDGIGIINCPGQMIQGGCEIERPIVQYDQFAGYLFQNENVKTLAVDGANRKWVGTMNGVWLISPDGDKIIARFTAENSPLPTNAIQKISVDPVTGDVYIGTEKGLVSYRGTATEGGESSQSVVTFPNPVPSGYSGTIAIRGLSTDADVKITDISGQLVYRTQALGGQAVWDGRDYTGRRPQSGVYLIFVSNKDGSQTYAGKMVFME